MQFLADSGVVCERGFYMSNYNAANKTSLAFKEDEIIDLPLDESVLTLEEPGEGYDAGGPESPDSISDALIRCIRNTGSVDIKRIAEYADDMGITDALANKVSSYSHGMKQKLAIVSALMHDPKLLIMDEPFVGLDPKAAFILKKFMRNFCDNGGAIFFSTHVLDVAEKLCDRIAIIRAGRLLADGDIETVKGNESLEEVFLELVDDIKVEDDQAREGEKNA